MLRVLLEQKAVIDYERPDGFTALMKCSLNGHESCVRALVEAGASVDAVTNNGATALHFVAFFNIWLNFFAIIIIKY